MTSKLVKMTQKMQTPRLVPLNLIPKAPVCMNEKQTKPRHQNSLAKVKTLQSQTLNFPTIMEIHADGVEMAVDECIETIDHEHKDP